MTVQTTAPLTYFELAGAEPLTRAEFTTQLRAKGRSYHDRHPFHVRMNAGELSREELATWVANRFAYQQVIPRKDAAILANCDERDVRRAWISRIIDHDGDAEREGGMRSWVQLGEAIGVAADELWSGQRVLPAVQFACDAYLNFCRTQPWIIGVASSLTELFGPDAIRVRIAAMESKYPWIDPSGFDYFRERLTLAPRDADYALELVLQRCTTRALQQAAIDALAFKIDMLWAQLDAIDLGDTRPKEAR